MPNIFDFPKKKPIYFVLIVSLGLFVFLPWSGIPFYTKGEPREALVAQQMMETGNYILPARYGDDIATKPPLTHWLICLFSSASGNVSELTARLPSVLAGILIAAYLFLFIKKRSTTKLALLSSALLLGSFEWFRAVSSARVDLPLTAFIILALLQFFRWEERLLNGFPTWAVVFMSMATLVKGPVGIVLPCFVLFVYLLIRRYKFKKICMALIKIGFASAIIPAIWYILAIRMGGDNFWAIFIDENFARFTGKMTIGGAHENSIWYMFGVFIAGAAPWVLIALFSVFYIKFKRPTGKMLKQILEMDKIKQFCLTAIFCILLFYAIPASKRSVYLLPAYPFVSVFWGYLIIWLTDNKTLPLKIFSLIIFFIGLCAIALITITPPDLFNDNFYLNLFGKIFNEKGIISILFFMIIILALSNHFINTIKNKNIIISAFISYFSLILFFNAVYHPIMAEHRTLKYFASETKQYAYSDKIFTYNEKMYCLNYYFHNKIDNDFEEEMPQKAYIFITKKRLKTFIENYDKTYKIGKITESQNRYNDMRDFVYLIKVEKK